MVHAVILLLVLVVLMPYAALIPMPAIAAILFMVAYNMCQWRTFVQLVKTAPKSDIAVLVLTFFLTVAFDLVVAIEVGMVLACLLFMKRMSDETGVKSWRYVEEMELEESEKEAQIGANERFDEAHEEHEQAKLRRIPRAISVFEITGPLFFGAADQISQIVARENSKILIVRMLRSGTCRESHG